MPVGAHKGADHARAPVERGGDQAAGALTEPDADEFAVLEPGDQTAPELRTDLGALAAGDKAGIEPEQWPHYFLEHDDTGYRVAGTPRMGFLPRRPRMAGLPGFMARP